MKSRHAENLAKVVRLGREWVSARRASSLAETAFADVEGFCFFIGYPRSGHTMIGSLIDAHPNAVIALELGALQYVRAHFDRQRLFYLLAKNAQESAAEGRPSGEYRYAVPGQWQGRHDHIHIIGDNKAEGATLRLRACPSLIERLERTARVPLRLIHVVRNPFDNITTMAKRWAQRASRISGLPEAPPDVTRAFERYRILTRTVVDLKRELGDRIWELRHEDFVADPRTRLGSLCEWLSLDPTPSYLDACAEVVWPNPQRTRSRLEWPVEAKRSVDDLIAQTPHLNGYTFDT